MTTLSGRFKKGSFSGYGLTLKAERLDDIVVVSVQGTTSSAISAWAQVITNIDGDYSPSVDVTMLGSSSAFYMESAGRLRASANVSSGTVVNLMAIFKSKNA